MKYYAVERKNSLQHHGILGMHWGIRRFQPYSTVPRKSGEGGKEVGEAKKASQNDNSSDFAKKYQHIKETAKTDEEKDALLHDLELDRDLGNPKVSKDKYGYINLDLKDGDSSVNFLCDPNDLWGTDHVLLGLDKNYKGLSGIEKDAEIYLKEAALNYQNNKNKINDAAMNAIMDDITSSGVDKNTAKQIVSKLGIKSVSMYGGDDVELSVWEKNDNDKFLGGHTINMEMDLKNPSKPKHGISING